MALVAGTTYYAVMNRLDKQGNQTPSAQQTIVADALHNADMHPDLQQNFFVYDTSGGTTLAAGGSGNQQLKFPNTFYLSGSGSYSASTGLYTVGAAGKMQFNCIVAVDGTGHSSGLASVVFKQNGTLAPFAASPTATVLVNPISGSTLCIAQLVYQASVAAADTIGVWIFWSGLGGQTIEVASMSGLITPG